MLKSNSELVGRLRLKQIFENFKQQYNTQQILTHQLKIAFKISWVSHIQSFGKDNPMGFENLNFLIFR